MEMLSELQRNVPSMRTVLDHSKRNKLPRTPKAITIIECRNERNMFKGVHLILYLAVLKINIACVQKFSVFNKT